MGASAPASSCHCPSPGPSVASAGSEAAKIEAASALASARALSFLIVKEVFRSGELGAHENVFSLAFMRAEQQYLPKLALHCAQSG